MPVIAAEPKKRAYSDGPALADGRRRGLEREGEEGPGQEENQAEHGDGKVAGEPPIPDDKPSRDGGRDPQEVEEDQKEGFLPPVVEEPSEDPRGQRTSGWPGSITLAGRSDAWESFGVPQDRSQPLTLPRVRPEIRYFEEYRNRITTGMVTRIEPAENWPH